jgi:hypothetical protein
LDRQLAVDSQQNRRTAMPNMRLVASCDWLIESH